jgi:hypothetical protein
VCKSARLYNGYPTSKDDHDSWEMCTTSVESQTVMTVILMVMNGMDPHMISGTWVQLVWLGQFWPILLVRSILHSGLCDLIDVLFLRLKDQRRRPEGGEWELIKIPIKNLAYISN